MTEWFVVQCKPNAHGLAALNLRRQGFNVFCPLTVVSRRRAERFVAERRPVFPGYFFVALDPKNASWRKVNSTFGVKRLLTSDGRPKAISGVLIEDLRARCDPAEVLKPASELAAGDRVKVVGGPFTSYFADVEAIGERERVKLLLGFWGQNIRLELDRTALELAQNV